MKGNTMLKTKLARTKKFVSDHRVAIAVAVTLTACAALQVRNQKVLNEFLEEKGLLEEYYTPEDSY
jgi:hypothetical protein